jgi:hypothetical protein
MPSISRRKVLSLGVSAGAVLFSNLPAAILPRQFFSDRLAGSKAGSGTLGVDDFLRVVPAFGSASDFVLNSVFPGLLSESGFRPFRPMSFLVSNVSNTDIRAFSVYWTVTKSRGEYKFTIRHYKRPRTGPGNKILFTGEVPIIRSGATRLVTPFFNWIPSEYSESDRPDWMKLATKCPALGLSEPTSAPSDVAMHIDALITDDFASLGPGDEYLAHAFCGSRNAEHDEAVAVRRQIGAGAQQEQVSVYLRREASGVDFDIQSHSALYYRVRQRQAKVLRRRLANAGWEPFISTLEYLRSQPKTRLGRLTWGS